MATEYDRHADLALRDAETYLANPINAYMLCKRFTTELPSISDLLWSAPLKTGMCPNKVTEIFTNYFGFVNVRLVVLPQLIG